MRVVIRADATRAIGTGHVMRCWALAEELASLGWEVSWHGTVNVPWLAALVAKQGWPVLPVVDGGTFRRGGTDLVVVDSYGDTNTYRRSAIENHVAVLAVVDHHHTALGPGSLWINPGPPMTSERNSRFLNGPDYILIRRDIRTLAEARDAYAPGSGLALLLGGTDAMGLAAIVEDLDVGERVVAGPGTGNSAGVVWLAPGPDLMREATRARLVVSPAGVSSWEMLHIGVPLALVLAAENQRGNYDWMTEQGWALGLGDGEDLPARIQEALRRANEGLLIGERRIDGLGVHRVLEAVLRLV